MLPARGLYGHIRNNYVKSAALLAGFVGLVAMFWLAWCLIYTAVLDGWLLGKAKGQDFGTDLVLIATLAAPRALANWYVPIFLSVCWFIAAYFIYSDLIRAATGSRPVTRKEAPRLYNLVENLAISCGLPVPRIEMMMAPELNAYAAGLTPQEAVVSVTTGLLDALDDEELEAVLAHEMAHIRHRDVHLMMIAAVFAGGLMLLGKGIGKLFQSRSDSGGSSGSSSSGGSSSNGSFRGGPPAAVAAAVAIGALFLALTHLFALLTRLAISRSREYLADAGAVELTKNPDALIRALRKISGSADIPDLDPAVSAMMISSRIEGLFSTHPPIEERIAAIVDFAGGRDAQPSVASEAPDRLPSYQEPAAAVDPASPWGRRTKTLASAAMANFGRRRSFLKGVKLPTIARQ